MDDRPVRKVASVREAQVRELLSERFKDVPYVRASSRAASTAAEYFSGTEFEAKSAGEASSRIAATVAKGRPSR